MTYMDMLKQTYGGFWEFKEYGTDMNKLKVFHKTAEEFKALLNANGINIKIAPHFILRSVQSSMSPAVFKNMLLSFVYKYLDKKEAEAELYPAADGRFELKGFYESFFLVFKDHGNRIDFISCGVPGERTRSCKKGNFTNLSNNEKKSYLDNKVSAKSYSKNKKRSRR